MESGMVSSCNPSQIPPCCIRATLAQCIQRMPSANRLFAIANRLFAIVRLAVLTGSPAPEELDRSSLFGHLHTVISVMKVSAACSPLYTYSPRKAERLRFRRMVSKMAEHPCGVSALRHSKENIIHANCAALIFFSPRCLFFLPTFFFATVFPILPVMRNSNRG
jgi:hypothetical protein